MTWVMSTPTLRIGEIRSLNMQCLFPLTPCDGCSAHVRDSFLYRFWPTPPPCILSPKRQCKGHGNEVEFWIGGILVCMTVTWRMKKLFSQYFGRGTWVVPLLVVENLSINNTMRQPWITVHSLCNIDKSKIVGLKFCSIFYLVFLAEVKRMGKKPFQSTLLRAVWEVGTTFSGQWSW